MGGKARHPQSMVFIMSRMKAGSLEKSRLSHDLERSVSHIWQASPLHSLRASFVSTLSGNTSLLWYVEQFDSILLYCMYRPRAAYNCCIRVMWSQLLCNGPGTCVPIVVASLVLSVSRSISSVSFATTNHALGDCGCYVSFPFNSVFPLLLCFGQFLGLAPRSKFIFIESIARVRHLSLSG